MKGSVGDLIFELEFHRLIQDRSYDELKEIKCKIRFTHMIAYKRLFSHTAFLKCKMPADDFAMHSYATFVSRKL